MVFEKIVDVAASVSILEPPICDVISCKRRLDIGKAVNLGVVTTLALNSRDVTSMTEAGLHLQTTGGGNQVDLELQKANGAADGFVCASLQDKLCLTQNGQAGFLYFFVNDILDTVGDKIVLKTDDANLTGGPLSLYAQSGGTKEGVVCVLVTATLIGAALADKRCTMSLAPISVGSVVAADTICVNLLKPLTPALIGVRVDASLGVDVAAPVAPAPGGSVKAVGSVAIGAVSNPTGAGGLWVEKAIGIGSLGPSGTAGNINMSGALGIGANHTAIVGQLSWLSERRSTSVVSVAAATTLTAADSGKIISVSGTTTVTLPVAPAVGTWYMIIKTDLSALVVSIGAGAGQTIMRISNESSTAAFAPHISFNTGVMTTTTINPPGSINEGASASVQFIGGTQWVCLANHGWL